MESISIRKDLVISDHYELDEKLGDGAYGEVWRAKDMRTGEQFAVKFEEVSEKHQQLYAEFKLYLWFHCDKRAKGLGIPKSHAYLTIGNKNIMMMDLLGKSLNNLWKDCGKEFSLKTVLTVGIEIMRILEFVHSRGILHRDIKPDNFAVWRNDKSWQIAILDFGLARKYLQPRGRHIECREGRPLTGTSKYLSINNHRGIEHSRRDDLESLVYMLIELANGSLPWSKLKGKDLNETCKMMQACKESLSESDICVGVSSGFTELLFLVKNLKFEEKPDYEKYVNLMKERFKKEGYEYDYKYDWIK